MFSLLTRHEANLLQDIKSLLSISTENQRDIIDLRTKQLEMDQKMMLMSVQLEKNVEAAKRDDYASEQHVKDHTAQKYITVKEHEKDVRTLLDKIDLAESKASTALASHKTWLKTIYVTASTIAAALVYIILEVLPHVG